MNGLISWFGENKVAAKLLMVFILVAGALSLPETRKETLPNISLDLITISVAYPGASPEDVENSIINRVESVIYDLEGIRSVSSRAQEHLGVVTADIAYGYDSRELLEDIKSRVEGISSLPTDAERPVINVVSVRNLVARVIVSGAADEVSLKTLAEKIKSDLIALPGISQIELASRPFEISIEVSELALRRYGLGFGEVAAAVRKNSLDVPTGVIKTSQGDVSIKATGQAYRGGQFEDIVVRATPDGARVFVGDIAKVDDGFKEGVGNSEFNGKPAIALSVYRVGNQSILEISRALHDYVENPGTFIPHGIKLDIWQDSSSYFKSRMDLLGSNAVGGLVLLFCILLLFLRPGFSFWISLGIPVSFMGAFWLLPYFGGSINMISMFALILVLGIVVDDAIIVGENIYARQRRGNSGSRAAILGAQEVASPIIFAVLTTIIAFIPLIFLPGPEGKLIRILPIVVISTLIFSLVESLLILPSHLSALKADRSVNIPVLGALQRRFSTGLEGFVESRYRPFLALCLRWRYTAVSGFVAILVVSFGLVAAGWLKIVFVSEIEADSARAEVTFPQGAAPDVVRSGIDRVQQAALDLKTELRGLTGQDQVLGVFTVYGENNSGRVIAELAPSEMRKVSSIDIADQWRQKFGDVPEATDLKLFSTFKDVGAAVNLELSSSSLVDLKQAADDLKVRLAQFDGVFDIRDSFREGKQELLIALKPIAVNMGLSLEQVAAQVRQAYQGGEVQTIQRGNSEVKVVIRYPLEERSSLWHLENMHISLGDGSSVPLLTIADIRYGKGASQITRQNGRRVINVTARLDDNVIREPDLMLQLNRDFLSSVGERYSGMHWQIAGSQKDKAEFKRYLKNSYPLALLGMYICMAILFRSYAQPLMVMFAIPFGLIGALFGHLLLGLELTLWSVIGMIAVSGVVVNDNLVLVNYINRKRRQGTPILEAIREAGAARFRPIILTSLTTFAGLVPLMLGESLQAQFLIPMAVSLAFGVLFATTVSLILVPALYFVLSDFEKLASGLLKGAFSEKGVPAAERKPVGGDLL